MMTSLNPVGEAARGQRWTVTVTAYLVGSTAGGALAGGALAAAVAALLPAPSTGVALGILAAVAAVGLMADRSRRLPTWHRQVDERWLTTYRGWVYGAGFGAQLGAGVATLVPASITYVVLAAAALSGSAGRGAVVGGLFGLARALPVLVTRSVRTPEALRSLHRRTVGWQRPVARLTTAAQAVALVALVTAVTA